MIITINVPDTVMDRAHRVGEIITAAEHARGYVQVRGTHETITREAKADAYNALAHALQPILARVDPMDVEHPVCLTLEEVGFIRTALGVEL